MRTQQPTRHTPEVIEAAKIVAKWEYSLGMTDEQQHACEMLAGRQFEYASYEEWVHAAIEGSASFLRDALACAEAEISRLERDKLAALEQRNEALDAFYKMRQRAEKAETEAAALRTEAAGLRKTFEAWQADAAKLAALFPGVDWCNVADFVPHIQAERDAREKAERELAEARKENISLRNLWTEARVVVTQGRNANCLISYGATQVEAVKAANAWLDKMPAQTVDEEIVRQANNGTLNATIDAAREAGKGQT